MLLHIQNGSLVMGLISGVALVVFSAGATPLAVPDFERYRVILDRKPFGEVTPSEPAGGILPVDSLTKDYEMRAIIDEGTTIRVGLLNKKDNINYYLNVGESTNGIELVSANYDNEEATLRRGSETVVLSLKPNKTLTNAPAGSAASFAALTGAGSMPAKPPAFGGFGALSGNPSTVRKPFFSDLKKAKTTPFKRLGSETPFKGETIESFLKARSEGGQPATTPLKFPDPNFKMDGQAGTINQLMKGSPNTAQPFAPIQPPSAGAAMEGRGETIEQLMRAGSEQGQPPPLIPVPVSDDSDLLAE